MLEKRFKIELSKYFLATLMQVLVFTGAVPVLAQTPENFKVALFGDQGLHGINGSRAIDVLNLIQREGAQAVVHAGDFEYEDDPQAWENQINSVLGAEFPYFAVIGNHDELAYESAPGGGAGYKSFMEDRMNRLGIGWSGTYGIKSTHYYQGIFFVFTTPGDPAMGGGTQIEQGNYIRDQLAIDNSIWTVSAWHHNMRKMQVGGKSEEAGWPVYEESRKGGGIIITGHEHSYSRTHLLSDMENQVIASTSDTLLIRNDDQTTSEDEGRTFATVSGLGGRAPRAQFQPSDDWWASIYTTTQGAKVGALFAEFNYNGDPRLAHFYFMNVDDEIIDEFWVRSNVDMHLPENNPPTAVVTSSVTSGETPLLVDFTGGNSMDADGYIDIYHWDFGDGNAANTANPSHTYMTEGTYTVSLTVTDDDGATDVTQLSITVTEPAEPPVARFTYAANDLMVDFTDTSTDDGAVVGWDWDFGDGNTANIANPSHTYMTAGTYTVSLTVTDDMGDSDAASQDVTVRADIVLSAEMPETFALSYNYPNPFNATTTIGFALPETSDVLLEVYDLMGRRISVLVEGQFGTGHYERVWDLRSETGEHVASGIYLYRLRAGSFDTIRRMVFIK